MVLGVEHYNKTVQSYKKRGLTPASPLYCALSVVYYRGVLCYKASQALLSKTGSMLHKKMFFKRCSFRKQIVMQSLPYLEFPLDFGSADSLDEITNFNIIKPFDGNTAFKPSIYLANVVFHPLE